MRWLGDRDLMAWTVKVEMVAMTLRVWVPAVTVCGNTWCGSSSSKHKACMGCFGESYCTRKCQKWAWTGKRGGGDHRAECLDVQELSKTLEEEVGKVIEEEDYEPHAHWDPSMKRVFPWSEEEGALSGLEGLLPMERVYTSKVKKE